MGRRHRHLNPVNAGATLALDSRFLFASNGDLVSTWPSRQGGIPGTAAGSWQPIFQTGIIGGNPALFFDGSGNRIVASISVTSNAVTALWVLRKTSYVGGASAYSRTGSLWNKTNTGNVDYGDATGAILAFIANEDAGQGPNRTTFYRSYTPEPSLPYSINTWAIGSTLIDGSQVALRQNKALATGTTTSTALNSNELVIGNMGNTVVNGSLNGHVASFTFFVSVLSASMIKRLEEASAFSFRLSYG